MIRKAWLIIKICPKILIKLFNNYTYSNVIYFLCNYELTIFMHIILYYHYNEADPHNDDYHNSLY